MLKKIRSIASTKTHVNLQRKQQQAQTRKTVFVYKTFNLLAVTQTKTKLIIAAQNEKRVHDNGKRPKAQEDKRRGDIAGIGHLAAVDPEDNKDES